MSWKSGVQMARELWEQLRPLIHETERQQAALVLVNQFRYHDCDIPSEEQLWTDAYPNGEPGGFH